MRIPSFLRVSGPEVWLALVFAGALPLAVGAAFGLESMAFKATNSWNWRSLPGSYVIALNTLPSLIAGMLVYAVISPAAYNLIQGSAWARWAPRTIVPSLFAAALVFLIALDWRSPDFWLVAQFLIWPLMAALGGLVAEGTVATYYRRRASHAAA